MDYLNRRKQNFNLYMLYVGYFFISIAIVFGSIMLIYQAYGVGIKNGQVVQSGLLVFSSQPKGADIYINDQKYQSSTNTSVVMPAGIYRVRLSKPGYTTWNRTIELDGNTVLHFDYPLLFPTKPITINLQTLDSAPVVASQSPDKRWAIVSHPGSLTSYDVFDLKSIDKAPVLITLPKDVTTTGTNESMDAVSWADDNTHLLLKHTYDNTSEYVLLDRSNPDQSVNLNKALNLNPTQLTLRNQKYDQYYIFDSTTGLVQSSSLSTPSPVTVASKVLAFSQYGSSTILYITPSGVTTNKVELRLLSSGKNYKLHAFSSGTSYLLGVNTYKDVLYVAAGAASENKVYIFADPIGQIGSSSKELPSPVQVLHVNQPNSLQFSSLYQYIVVENGQQFGVYDIKNGQGYNYSQTQPLDAPQLHASWVDPSHLAYISAGKLMIFDYDGNNSQEFISSSPDYLPFFAGDNTSLTSLSSANSAGQVIVQNTPLVIK